MQGSRVRSARKESGLTQTQLADLIGTTHGQISQWERGDIRSVSADLAFKAARALNVSPEWIVNGRDSRSSNLSVRARDLAADFDTLHRAAQEQVLQFMAFILAQR